MRALAMFLSLPFVVFVSLEFTFEAHLFWRTLCPWQLQPIQDEITFIASRLGG